MSVIHQDILFNNTALGSQIIVDCQGNVTIPGNLKVGGFVTGSSDAFISGSLVVEGTITAQEYYTEFISASIIYESGSTLFGNSFDDVHEITGSLRVIGNDHHFFGNIGIGTDIPNTKLQIFATSSVPYTASGNFVGPFDGDFINLQRNGSNSTGSYVGINIIGSTNNASAGRIALVHQSSLNGDFVFQLRDAGSNTVERMRITSEGVVQISSSLDVSGLTKFGSFLTDIHQFTGSVNITGSLNINGEDIDTRLDKLEATASDHETRLDNEEATSSNHETRIDNIELSGSSGLGFWSGSGANISRTSDVLVTGSFDILGDNLFFEVQVKYPTILSRTSQSIIAAANPTASVVELKEYYDSLDALQYRHHFTYSAAIEEGMLPVTEALQRVSDGAEQRLIHEYESGSAIFTKLI